MSTKKLLALIIGIPFAIWILGIFLDASKVTGNITTPLTKFVLDFWLLVAVCFVVTRLTKKKKV
jgi:hypothetical protein